MTVDNAGNRNDFVFGCAEGWGAFEVVRFHAVEEISRPYRFDLILLRRAAKGPADLDALLDAPVSLRIATKERWRVVHGIVGEAEELDRTGEIILYRVLVVPHVERAAHRRRCRTFVEASIRELIVTVLENRSPAHPTGSAGLVPLVGEPTPPEPHPSFDAFTPPDAKYRIAITNPDRIDDVSIVPYTVQYNESDFAFLSRLLEREGLSYLFEQLDDGTLLTITDILGTDQQFKTDAVFELRGVSKGGGATRDQEVVRTLREARRLRSKAVTVREYDWHRSKTTFDAATQLAEEDRLGVFQFGGEDENSQARPGDQPANVRRWRLDLEAVLLEGTSTVRTKTPGYRFQVRDADGLRNDVDLFLVRIETWGAAIFPESDVLDEQPFGGAPVPKVPTYRNRFLAIPLGYPFVPAMATPKPHIAGVHSAVVTAEEFSGDRPEINADKNGCVRIRFPWDQRPDTNDGRPTSCWVRVSQLWAGAAYGGLMTPRVGHEVLVAFMGGDPDRPVIVGRVHNPQSPPPYDPSTKPTYSTIKSQSSPHAEGSNELRFEDAAGAEEVYLHAQRNFDELVENDHTVGVAHNELIAIGNDQSTGVMGNRSLSVDGNDSNQINGRQSTTVSKSQDNTVGGPQTNSVGGNRTHSVTGHEFCKVGAGYQQTVTGSHGMHASGEMATRSETLNQDATGPITVTSNTMYTVNTPKALFRARDSFAVESKKVTTIGESVTLKTGNAELTMSDGFIVLDNGAGARVMLIGAKVVVLGSDAKIDGTTTVALRGGGAKVDLAAGDVNLNK